MDATMSSWKAHPFSAGELEELIRGINPATAKIDWGWGQILDPYGREGCMSCQEQNHWLREWLCAIATTQKPRNGAGERAPRTRAAVMRCRFRGWEHPPPSPSTQPSSVQEQAVLPGGWGWVSVRQRCNDATLYGGPGWGLD